MKFSNINNDNSRLINKFEQAIKEENLKYFDNDEIDIIIEHYIATSNNKLARKAINYGLQLYPNNIDIQLNEAKILFIEKRYKKTIELISLYSNYKDSTFTLLLAKSHLQLNHYKIAKRFFEQYFTICDINILEDIFESTAQQFNDKNQYKIALEIIHNGLIFFPNNVYLLMEKGYTYSLIDDYEKSIIEYNKALNIDPFNIDAWLELCKIHIYNKEYEKAIEDNNYAMTLIENNNLNVYNPICKLAIFLKGECYYFLEMFDKAYENYITIENFMYDDNDFIEHLGYIYQLQNRWDKAKKLYETVFEKNIYLPSSTYGILECFKQENDNLGAYKFYKKYFTIFKNQHDIRYLYAHYALIVGFDTPTIRNEAINNLLICHHIFPKNLTINMEIGNYYFLFCKYTTALEYFNIVYNINPDQNRITIFLSMCYYAINDIENMKKYYLIAKTKDYDSEDFFLNIFPKAKNLISDNL